MPELQTYNRKRNFKSTSEPRGKKVKGTDRDFMIHMHDARRLHYDVRLQWHGVLLSWAVPKGPSLNPSDKRLAVRTEDHPVDYKSFEGVIPEKSYGAGPSLIWDAGQWRPLVENVDAALKKGRLRFYLKGVRLRGIWNLIRMHGKGKEQWLMIKESDKYASRSWSIEKHATSVATGRTFEEMSSAANGKTKKISAATEVELTHPDKILFADQGLTKADLLEYYKSVFDEFMKLGAMRPLSLVRCPNGSQKQCFFQKHMDVEGDHPPQIEIKTKNSTGKYPYIETFDDLASIIQLGTLELHGWNCTVEDTDRPQFVVWDLDPGEGVTFSDITKTAHLVRLVLEKMDYEAFVRTSGGKGLHVLTTVKDMTWEKSKAFSKEVGELMMEARPDFYLLKSKKDLRKDHIFIDYLRNSKSATSILTFSTRARPGAPVSYPLEWKDVNDTLDPKKYNVKTVPKLLAKRRVDPWKGFYARLK